VETFYSRDAGDAEWLGLVADRLRPLLDKQGLGMLGLLFHCPDPCALIPQHVLLCETPEELQPVIFEGVKSFTPTYIAESYLNRSCCMGSDVRDWGEIAAVRKGLLVDAIQFNVVEPDGYGCHFCSPQYEAAPMSADEYLALTRLAKHLAAAHRLRRKHPQPRVTPETAEAILAPDGRVCHAEGPAKERASQASLTSAARTMDTVRTRRRPVEPQQAIQDWRSIVEKRWTLLDHYESDGKRFLLAMENRSKGPSLELLSERERDVVFRALKGQDNKVIAHELGVAHQTVRVLFARAAAKLKVKSRKELLEKVGQAVSPEGLSSPA
jgi:DNA-binding CsgD family transcriptional regulator